MEKRNDIVPIIFVLFIVAGMSAWKGFWADKLSTAPVDNPVDGTVIELSGPGLRHGFYTFFSNPLTLGELCVNIYPDARCGRYAPAEKDRLLASGDAVYFPVGGGPLRTGRMSGARRLALGIRLDPNSDSVEDLTAVRGIGPRTAERLVRRREEIGPFRTMDELQEFLGARISASEYFRVEWPEK